ncbi:MAG: hypothetical protein E7624_08825 [Ruminococcaceae bacterium]|nr:hypothetical protein [Oscillospiraceae bacterium]
MERLLFALTQQDVQLAESDLSVIETIIWIFVIAGALAILIFFRVLVAHILCPLVLKKGYSLQETKAFWKCFWLGIPGYIYVLALPDRNLQMQNDLLIAALQQIAANNKKE